jgi:hypothetical protein
MARMVNDVDRVVDCKVDVRVFKVTTTHLQL